MSRIYFHSPSETAEVSGAERHHMGIVCDEVFLSSLSLTGEHYITSNEEHPLYYVTNPEHYSRQSRGDAFIKSLALSIKVSSGKSPIRYWNGKEMKNLNLLAACLNTVCAVGSDPLKLYARIHGQCEIHCYVEGRNREWLASIIQLGLDCGLYRKTPKGYPGWDDVITMLCRRNDEPVVLSYSVCDQFPSPTAAANAGFEFPPDKKYPEDRDVDAFYDLPDEERWAICMKGLRDKEDKQWLELTPDRWEYPKYHFGEKLTGYQIYAAALDLQMADPAVLARAGITK